MLPPQLLPKHIPPTPSSAGEPLLGRRPSQTPQRVTILPRHPNRLPPLPRLVIPPGVPPRLIPIRAAPLVVVSILIPPFPTLSLRLFPTPYPIPPPLLRPITFPTPILRSLRFHQHVPPTTNTTNPNTHGNPIYNPGPVGGPVLTGGGECHVPWHGLQDHVFSPAPGLHLDLNSPSSSVQSNQLHSCCQPVYPCLCDREGLGPTNTVGPGIQVLAPPPGGRAAMRRVMFTPAG